MKEICFKGHFRMNSSTDNDVQLLPMIHFPKKDSKHCLWFNIKSAFSRKELIDINAFCWMEILLKSECLNEQNPTSAYVDEP